MDETLFQDIGLTKGETKIYLTLLELGISTTGPLVKKSGVSASKAYLILNNLAKKGLVGHVMKGGVRYFRAAEPNRIIDYLEEKEKEAAEKKKNVLAIIPELLSRQQRGPESRSAEIYEGKKGVMNLFWNILDDLKKGQEYYVIGAGYGFEEASGLRNFFLKYHETRAKKGVKVLMLANHSVMDELVPTTRKCGEVRFLPEDLITNVQITFYKRKTFIVLWNKDPIAFLIHNSEIVKGFHGYFDSLWKKARKASL